MSTRSRRRRDGMKRPSVYRRGLMAITERKRRKYIWFVAGEKPLNFRMEPGMIIPLAYHQISIL